MGKSNAKMSVLLVREAPVGRILLAIEIHDNALSDTAYVLQCSPRKGMRCGLDRPQHERAGESD